MLIGWCLPAEAAEPRLEIDVAATTLPDALSELARETGASIGTAGGLPGVRTRKVRGTMPVDRALAQMLEGSGFRAIRVGPNAWRIEPIRLRAKRPKAPAPVRVPEPALVAPVPPTPEILVTGTKIASPLGSTPGGVAVVVPTAIDGPLASAGSAVIASRIDGLALTGEGSGRNRMFLRGVADSPFAGTSQSTVAVLLGESRLTWSAPDPDIRLVDVRQVEVLKGPQGSLYGTGALGGIYRVVPNAPDLTQFSMVGEISGPVASGGGAGGSASAVVNLPVISEVAAVRLVAYGENVPGWINTGTRSDSNRGTTLGGRVAVGVDAGAGWRIDATGFAQFLNSRDSNYTYAPHARARSAQMAEPHDNDLVHGAIRVEHDSGAIDLVGTSGFTAHAIDDRYDATIGAAGLGLADPSTLDVNRHYTVFDNELRAQGTIGEVHWLAGLSYVVATQNSLRTVTSVSGDKRQFDRDRRRSIEAAVYARATFPLADRVDLTAGGRLSQSRLVEVRTRTAGEDTEGRGTLAFTPAVSLAWAPRPGSIVYAAFDTAVREGGATVAADGTFLPVDGDELATFSLGWRRTRGPVQFDLGVYRSRWSSVQSDVLRAGGLIETANVGNASILGAEASIDADLAQGWAVRAGLTVQSALLDPEAANGASEDRRLPVVPETAARFAVEKDFLLGNWEFKASLGARYTGTGRLSFDPALDRKLGGYLDTRIALAASRGPLVLAFSVENLFDARADQFAYGNPLRILTSDQHVSQQPRRATLSVTWRR